MLTGKKSMLGGAVRQTTLGLDLGTSAVKAVVADERGTVLAQASAPLSVQRPHPGWSEQSPDAWWQATVAAVRTLPPELRRAVSAVGCGFPTSSHIFGCGG